LSPKQELEEEIKGKEVISEEKMPSETPKLDDIAEEIIHAEVERNSWTLMHRFNLCYDLLDRVRDNVYGLALLFVWLRFSAIRQLDWQRNYNTKPRELSHSQDRLTLKLAEIYKDRNSKADIREIIRLIFTTIGRGGEGGKGQRIRDDILNIMHRYDIKENSNTFMEQWHQKLHNNATPDDIVICEAYLKFLRSNGDLNIFYKILENSGVTKKRLESFERPIVSDPDFVPHLKDGLIHDFENYLRLLKSIHSATDLLSAIEAAEYCLDKQLEEQVKSIHQLRDDPYIQMVERVSNITDVRRCLNRLLNKDIGERCVRDILYLDLALEEFLRTVMERNIHKDLNREQLLELILMVLENLRFYHENDELQICYNHWRKLKYRLLNYNQKGFDQEWSLHAKSVIDRIGSELGALIDYYNNILQSKAEHLGNAFHADSWTIDLFTQEVIRGTVAFILSILIRHIDSILRKSANLGDWQVISQNEAIGQVEIGTLISIKDKKFDYPTVIITDKVMGDEVIPEGVTAVITSDVVDILSHVSVRARDACVLFATCYDMKIIDKLKSLKGAQLRFMVNASGEVEFEEVKGEISSRLPELTKCIPPKGYEPISFEKYAVSLKDFTDKLVGRKSYNLWHLKDNLPAWTHLPTSVAVPFRVFTEILRNGINKKVKERYDILVNQVDKNPGENLPKLRNTIMDLISPEELKKTLLKVMEVEGLLSSEEWHKNWNNIWDRIKYVWASRWNERAYLNRKRWKIKHAELHMAVLIQQVVNAEYAFVIHTANPFTLDRDELYAEVVLGLGETLCSGNYPGRSLSFICKKKELKPQLLSFPNKKTGLYGKGLIFRSDSNGEDLEDYAGAGLYDSVLLERPQEVSLDYTKDIPLLWDDNFRKKFMTDITKIGIEIEKIMKDSPQDIEGAYVDRKYYVVQTRPQVGMGCGTKK